MTKVEVMWDRIDNLGSPSKDTYEFDVPDDGKFEHYHGDDEIRFTVKDSEGGDIEVVSLSWSKMRFYRIMDDAKVEADRQKDVALV